MSEALLDRAKSQGRWLVAAEGATRLIQFALSIVLARVLLPEHFGIVTIALGIWAVIALFGSTNYLFATLVQRRGDIAEMARAAFWLNLAVAAAVTLIGIAAGAVAGWVYGEPRMPAFIACAASGLVVRALGTVHAVLLTRDLAFRRVAASEAAAATVNTALAVVFAAAGFGAWSLVLPAPLAEGLRVAVLWRLHQFRPDFKPRLHLWSGLYRYGRWILGGELATCVIANADSILAGKLLGPAAVGIYGRGFRLANLPVDAGIMLVARVAFPTLSALQDDRVRFAETTARMLRVVNLLVAPAVAVLWVAAPDAIAVLYGEERWGPAAPLVRILLPSIVLRALATASSQVLYATGYARQLFAIHAALAIPIVVAIGIGAWRGLHALAAAVSIGLGALAIVLLARSAGVAGLDRARLGSALVPGLAVAAVALAGAAGATLVAGWLAPGASRVGLQAVRLALALAGGGSGALAALRFGFRADLGLLARASGLAALVAHPGEKEA